MKKKSIILIIISIILIVYTYTLLCLHKDTIAMQSGDKYLPLYKGMFTYIIENNKDLVNDIEYIAFDPYSFKLIRATDQKELSTMLNKYTNNIILGSFNILNNEDFTNSDGTMKGIYIYATNFEEAGNRLKLDYTLYRGNKSIITYTVKATYHNNNWKVKYTEYKA